MPRSTIRASLKGDSERLPDLDGASPPYSSTPRLAAVAKAVCA